MIDQVEPPTAGQLEAALLVLLLADRRRRWRERTEAKQMEDLLDEARGLLPDRRKEGGGSDAA